MYLHSKLEDHKENIHIAFIGCGKFISMFLSQYNQLKKIKIDTIIDLDIERAKSNCIKSGLNKDKILHEEDKILLYKFYLKIKNEFKEIEEK